MKLKLVVAIYVILLIFMLNLLFINIENTLIIDNYEKAIYLEGKSKMLTNLAFQKSYVLNYNYGNILYQKGEYEKAIIEYEKSLKTVVSKEKECKIRINCALATCKTVQLDETSQDSINKAIETYEKAIEVLTEKECDAHNEDAERLRKDIEDETQRLKKMKKNTKNENKQEENNKSNEENIEDKIQNVKEEAINEQRKMESTYQNYNKGYKTRGKNW